MAALDGSIGDTKPQLVAAIARQLNAPTPGATSNSRPVAAQANRPGAVAQKTNPQ